MRTELSDLDYPERLSIVRGLDSLLGRRTSPTSLRRAPFHIHLLIFPSHLTILILPAPMSPFYITLWHPLPFCPTLIVCSSFASPFDNILPVTSTFVTVSVSHAYTLAHNILFSLLSLRSRTAGQYHLFREHVAKQSQRHSTVTTQRTSTLGNS